MAHHLRFQLRQFGHRIHVVERSEQLILCYRVAMRAVAADADADRSRRAALALSLPDSVEQALSNSFESSIGAAKLFERAGQGVLDVLVLAAAALQHKLYFDFILLPLLEVDDRRLRSQIVATVFAADRVN